MKLDKIHKIHVPKIKKTSPCWVSQDHGVLGGTLKWTKIDKLRKIHVSKSRGVFVAHKKSPCGMSLDHGVVVGRIHMAT